MDDWAISPNSLQKCKGEAEKVGSQASWAHSILEAGSQKRLFTVDTSAALAIKEGHTAS